MAKKDRVQEELIVLCELIKKLDSIRAYKRTENLKPEAVKNDFKRLKYRYLRKDWKLIRHDIEKIVYLPINIEGLPTMIRIVTYLKIILPITMIFMILSVSHPLTGHAMIPIPKFSPFIGIIPPLIVISMFILLDRKIRKRVMRYEVEHKEKLRRSRKRIKSLIDKLISMLLEELEKCNRNPNQYSMSLFYKDYKNIKIIKESKGKIFKRKYPTYLVVPARAQQGSRLA